MRENMLHFPNKLQRLIRDARAGSRGSLPCLPEPLEARLLYATIQVNSSDDSNTADDHLTLREAILIGAGKMTRAVTTAERNQVSGSSVKYLFAGFDSHGQSLWTFTDGVGSGFLDSIVFASSVTGTITPGSELPRLED